MRAARGSRLLRVAGCPGQPVRKRNATLPRPSGSPDISHPFNSMELHPPPDARRTPGSRPVSSGERDSV
eukprot:6337449-Alexandrium_andersonii.AAC.1